MTSGNERRPGTCDRANAGETPVKDELRDVTAERGVVRSETLLGEANAGCIFLSNVGSRILLARTAMQMGTGAASTASTELRGRE